MPDALTALVQPWADFYSASAWLPTAVIAGHVLAMFVGGSVAVGADRRVLRLTHDVHDGGVREAVQELASSHTIVIGALSMTVASGMALFAADVATFWGTPWYWLKMAAFAALLMNGWRMRATEQRVVATDSENNAGAVATLRMHAIASLAGWMLVVLLGVIVANV